ncbi:hypothetical protein GCM10009689_23150 [Brevibacterium antiquum]
MQQASGMPPYDGANAYGANGQYPSGSFVPPARKRKKNVMGIVAFIIAVVGFIFACIPGALIMGWILLPIAFLLAIISFFLKGGKGFSIAALILSVVGTIVAILVFLFVVASSFDDAFSDDVSAEAPAEEVVAEAGEAEEAGAEEGTRENPYSIGTKISSDAWDMTITSVTLDATDEVLAENEFNEKPDSGNQYMMVDVEMTYTGDAPDGEMPMATFEYVSVGGNTFDGLDDMVVAPNALDDMENMYNGATTSGSIAIQIPSEDAEAGVLAVNPDMFADKVYVAVK